MAEVLDSKTVQYALIGGGIYLIWQFKDVIFPATELLSDVSKDTGEALEWYGDTMTGATKIAPEVILGGGKALVSGDPAAQDKVLRDLQKSADAGNPFAKLVVGIGGDIDFGDATRPTKKSGAFGDQVDPHLLKHRIWADATQIDNRDQLRSWNIVLDRKGQGDYVFADVNKLRSFDRAITKQAEDINWAVENYPSVGVRSIATQRAQKKYKNNPNIEVMFQPGETFSNPSDNAYNAAAIFWNLEDSRSIAYFLDDDGNKTGDYVNLGLAGALDDAFKAIGKNWETEWANDKERARELMIDALNALEIPIGYLSPFYSSNEANFMRHYGIEAKQDNFIEPPKPRTEAQKAVGWGGTYVFFAKN